MYMCMSREREEKEGGRQIGERRKGPEKEKESTGREGKCKR